MSVATADVAVVGLGAMGAATLYQLARRGVRAIGIDRFVPPHDKGSSHGETRITRCGVGEGAAYVPLVQRSHEIWRALEAETGEALLHQVGCLILRDPREQARHHGIVGFAEASAAVARQTGIAHELLDEREIAARFPALRLSGGETGYFEPDGGYVLPEACVAAQLDTARRLGAGIMAPYTVTALDPGPHGVRIETDQGPIEAQHVVVAAGPWAGSLLGAPFDRLLRPYLQTLAWFPIAAEALAQARALPVFIWTHGQRADDHFYGFPVLPGVQEIKLATEQMAVSSDPDRSDRAADAEQVGAALYREHLDGRIRGLRPAATRAVTCFYTVTPDSGFVIDRHPASERVTVVSACSGHGFKHSAGIGDAVAGWIAEGRSFADLSSFAVVRFASAGLDPVAARVDDA